MIEFTTPWENSPASGSNRSGETGSAPEKIRILVAEDDPVSRELISSRLTRWGYEVVVTNDGTEAMTILRGDAAPALAILDWMMPGMDGLEICRRMRDVEKLIYIILLTARSGKHDIVEGLKAGADDYLIKPFDKDELHARILVGLRVIGLQTALTERVRELEAASSQIAELKLQFPL